MFISVPWENGKLKVASNGRYLCHENGTPFFWTGDTGWLMFNRLTIDEAETYLEDRRKKGFNVIQAMLLHKYPQVNAYGHVAEIGSGSSLEGKYWEHVDTVVEIAASKGIYVAMVPVWGSIVEAGLLDRDSAYKYAKGLALRYRNRPNIIWINGGDTRGSENTEIWRLIGNTIKEHDTNHLMTFHPFGRTQSSTWFHNEPWLDFNMFQSGHRRYDQMNIGREKYSDDEWKGEDNWRYVFEDYLKEPPKPTIDGEPSYEGIPQGLHDPKEPYWTEHDCRRYAYWSVFAGAFGHTYGHNAIMQMHKPEYGEGAYGVREYWYEALDAPGSFQMMHLKNLIISVPFFERVNDQSAIIGSNGDKYDFLIATRGNDYLFVYTYTGRKMSIDTSKISGTKAMAYWYSPRDGSFRTIGEAAKKGSVVFNPPGKESNGNDWVLVLINPDKITVEGGTLCCTKKTKAEI